MTITAADMMTTNTVTLTPEMTLSEMDSVLVGRGVSGAPVVEDGRLVGVASQADIIRTLWEGQNESAHRAPYYANPPPVPVSALAFIARDSQGVGDALIDHTVRDVMTSEPLVTHPSESIQEVAGRMVRDKIHRLPVTEEETGKLIGIITTLDLARAIERYGLGPDV